MIPSFLLPPHQRPLAFLGDSQNEVTVLINYGYIVGYSATRKQPVWAAYRVSDAQRTTHYERPHFFYKDTRLPSEAQVEPTPFPNFHRGHMVPNFEINTQYGKLAQLETFLMSNISPQKGPLNTGAWARLEKRIVNDYAPTFDHIWVIAGPIFESDEGQVRGVDIPSHFFMILVDAFGPFNATLDILALKFSQDTPSGAQLNESFIRSVDHLEDVTNLNFFPGFSAQKEEQHERNRASSIWGSELR